MSLLEALKRTLLLCKDFVPEASDEEIVSALSSTRVAIVSDAKNLSSVSGQAVVAVLSGLVLRYGCTVRLVMPEERLLHRFPPLRGDFLRQSLIDAAPRIFPGGRVELAEQADPRDLVFIVGNTPWVVESLSAWRLSGRRWEGQVLSPDYVCPMWTTELVFGALIAATIAAAEPFKHAMRALRAQKGLPQIHDELLPSQSSCVALASENIPQAPLDLGAFDLVSGGAISNALLHALLCVPGVKADVRVIEPEVVDLSNLNRYMLALLEHLGLPKTEVLEGWSCQGVRVKGVQLRFDSDTKGALVPLADTVLVGTDDIPSRWLVQKEWPVWLGIGATAHFTVVVSEHSSGMGCAGCLHPEDDEFNGPIATISFVSYWAGLVLASKLIRWATEASLPVEQQVLEISALRPGAKTGVWWHPTQRSLKCPIHYDLNALAAE